MVTTSWTYSRVGHGHILFFKRTSEGYFSNFRIKYYRVQSRYKYLIENCPFQYKIRLWIFLNTTSNLATLPLVF